jgi:chemotaxis protein histidine kinase CheA
MSSTLQDLIDQPSESVGNYDTTWYNKFRDEYLVSALTISEINNLKQRLLMNRHNAALREYFGDIQNVSFNTVMLEEGEDYKSVGDFTPDGYNRQVDHHEWIELTITNDMIKAEDLKRRKYSERFRLASTMTKLFHILWIYSFDYTAKMLFLTATKFESGRVETLELKESLHALEDSFIKGLANIGAALQLLDSDNDYAEGGIIEESGRDMSMKEFASKFHEVDKSVLDQITRQDPEWETWLRTQSMDNIRTEFLRQEYLEHYRRTEIPKIISEALVSVALHKNRNNDHTDDNGSINNFFIPTQEAILGSFAAKESNFTTRYDIMAEAKPDFHCLWTESENRLTRENQDTKSFVLDKLRSCLEASKKNTTCNTLLTLLSFPDKLDFRNLEKKQMFNENRQKSEEGSVITMNARGIIRFTSRVKAQKELLEGILHVGKKKPTGEITKIKSLDLSSKEVEQKVNLFIDEIGQKLAKTSKNPRHKIGLSRQPILEQDASQFSKFLENTAGFQAACDIAELMTNVQTANAQSTSGYMWNTCSNDSILCLSGPCAGLFKSSQGNEKHGTPSVPMLFFAIVKKEEDSIHSRQELMVGGLRILEKFESKNYVVYMSQASRLDKPRISAMSVCDIKFAVAASTMEVMITKNKAKFLHDFGFERSDQLAYWRLLAASFLASTAISIRTTTMLDHFRYLIPNSAALLSNAPGYIQDKFDDVAKTNFQAWLYYRGKEMLSKLLAANRASVFEKVDIVGNQTKSIHNTGVTKGDIPTILGKGAEVKDIADSMSLLYTLFFCCPKGLHYFFHREIGFYLTPLKFEKKHREEYFEHLENSKSPFYYDWKAIKYTTIVLDRALTGEIKSIRNRFYHNEKWDKSIHEIKTFTSLKSSLGIIGELDQTGWYAKYVRDPKAEVEAATQKYKENVTNRYFKERERNSKKKGKKKAKEESVKEAMDRIHQMVNQFRDKITNQYRKRQLYKNYIATSVERVIDNVLKLVDRMKTSHLRELAEKCLELELEWMADIFKKGQRTAKDREIYRLTIIMKVGIYMMEHFYKCVAESLHNEVISESGDEKIVDMQRRLVQASKKAAQWKKKAADPSDEMYGYLIYTFKLSLDMTKYSPSDNTFKYLFQIIYTKMLTHKEKTMFMKAIQCLRRKRVLFNGTLSEIFDHMINTDQLDTDNIFYKMSSDLVTAIHELEKGESINITPHPCEKVQRLEQNWFWMSENWTNGAINYMSSVNHVGAGQLFLDCCTAYFPYCYGDQMIHSDDHFTILVIATKESKLEAAYMVDALLSISFKKHCWKLSDKKSYFAEEFGEMVSQINVNHEQKSIWQKGALAAASGLPYSSFEIDTTSSASKVMMMSANGAPKTVCEISMSMMSDKICKVYGLLNRQINSPTRVFEKQLHELPLCLGGTISLPTEIMALTGPSCDYTWKISNMSEKNWGELLSIDDFDKRDLPTLALFGHSLKHSSMTAEYENYEGEKVKSLIQFGQFVNKRKVEASQINQRRLKLPEDEASQQALSTWIEEHPSYTLNKPSSFDSYMKYLFKMLFNPNYARSLVQQRPEQLLLDRLLRKYSKCCWIELPENILDYKFKDINFNPELFEEPILEDDDSDNESNIDTDMSYLDEVDDAEVPVEDELNPSISVKAAIQDVWTKVAEIIPEFERNRFQFTLKEAFEQLHELWKNSDQISAAQLAIDWYNNQTEHRSILKVYSNLRFKRTNIPKKTTAALNPRRLVNYPNAVKKPLAKVLAWGLDNQTCMENRWIQEDEFFDYDQEWKKIKPAVLKMIENIGKSGVTKKAGIFITIYNLFNQSVSKSKVFFINDYFQDYDMFVSQWLAAARDDYRYVMIENVIPLDGAVPRYEAVTTEEPLQVALKTYSFLACLTKDPEKLKIMCRNTYVGDFSVWERIQETLTLSGPEKRPYMVPLYHLFDDTNFQYKNFNIYIPIVSQVKDESGNWVGEFLYFYKTKYKKREITYIFIGNDNKINEIESSEVPERCGEIIPILKGLCWQLWKDRNVLKHLKMERLTESRECIVLREYAGSWTQNWELRHPGQVCAPWKYQPGLTVPFEVEIMNGSHLNQVIVYTMRDNVIYGKSIKYISYDRKATMKNVRGEFWINYLPLTTWAESGLADNFLKNRHMRLTAYKIWDLISDQVLILPFEWIDTWSQEIHESYQALPAEDESVIEINEEDELESTTEDLIGDVYTTESEAIYNTLHLDLHEFSVDGNELAEMEYLSKISANIVFHTPNGKMRVKLWNMLVVILEALKRRRKDLKLQSQTPLKKNSNVENLMSRLKTNTKMPAYKNYPFLFREIMSKVIDWYDERSLENIIVEDDV